MWESFSIYGMRALLILYLVSQLGFSDPKAYGVYSLFSAFAYLVPVFAGIIADRLLGYKIPIIIGSIIMCLGHFIMTFINLNTNIVYFGLGLIATGSGLFRGNLINLLGGCYKKDDPEKERGFTLLYIAVNVGGFIAMIGCSYIAHYIGWDYGFGLAGIFMLFGTIVFLKYQYLFKNIGNSPNFSKVKSILSISLEKIIFFGSIAISALFAVMLYYNEQFIYLLDIFGLFIVLVLGNLLYKSNRLERQNLIVLLILTIFFMLIYATEMHLGSLINLFTERNVNKTIFGFEIPAAALQSLNPAYVMIFGPFIANYFAQKEQPLLRFFMGLVFMLICFLLLYIGCKNHNEFYQSNLIYLFLSIAMMSLTELYVAPLLFSLYNALSPKKIQGFMMGIMLLSIAYSSIIGGEIAKLMSIPKDIKNAKDSLLIYQEGFFNISLFYFALTFVFLITIPFLKRLMNKNT